MMDLLSIYILNLLVMVGMFIVTIYRAWIEHKQMKAKQKINMLIEILDREKDQLKTMTGEEFIEMLRTVIG